MRSNKNCTRERLADAPHCAVDRCSCGHVTLHVGATSIRVPEEMLLELTQTLNIALVTSRTPSGELARPAPMLSGPPS